MTPPDSPPPPEVTAPTYLGMVICDNVLRDPETKKYFLMGTATVTYARSFPARYQKMCIYAVLTGIRAPTPITLRIAYVDSDNNADVEVMSIEGTVDARDPLTVAELTLGLRNLRFPRAGEYRFQLWSRGSFLGERKFHVHPMSTERD
jgi:hypothetical protein